MKVLAARVEHDEDDIPRLYELAGFTSLDDALDPLDEADPAASGSWPVTSATRPSAASPCPRSGNPFVGHATARPVRAQSLTGTVQPYPLGAGCQPQRLGDDAPGRARWVRAALTVMPRNHVLIDASLRKPARLRHARRPPPLHRIRGLVEVSHHLAPPRRAWAGTRASRRTNPSPAWATALTSSP